MAKCAGCSGTGFTGLTITPSVCIDTSGVGTVLSPLTIDPAFDPDFVDCINCGPDGIQLVLDPAGGITCGPDGLAASGGGGGVIDSYMFIASDDSALVAAVTPTTVPVDPAALGGTVFVSRGTDITWSAGNPTRVTINTTGVYDIEASLAFSNGGGAPITVHTYLSLNGGTTYGTSGFQLMANPVIIPNGAANFAGTGSAFNGLALSAADYLELTTYVLGTGGTYLYGGVTVRRTV